LQFVDAAAPNANIAAQLRPRREIFFCFNHVAQQPNGSLLDRSDRRVLRTEISRSVSKWRITTIADPRQSEASATGYRIGVLG
jgi:hypothetical protein